MLFRSAGSSKETAEVSAHSHEPCLHMLQVKQGRSEFPKSLAFSLVVAAADGSEPEFTGRMLVEYGVTMEFRPSPSSARLFLNSIVSDSFISGLEALSEHRDYLRFFGDAVQFEKEGF